MGLNFRKRIRVAPGVSLNLSKSGPSLSGHVGPVTVNTRGRGRVNLGNGISYTASTHPSPTAAPDASPAPDAAFTVGDARRRFRLFTGFGIGFMVFGLVVGLALIAVDAWIVGYLFVAIGALIWFSANSQFLAALGRPNPTPMRLILKVVGLMTVGFVGLWLVVTLA